MGRAEGGDVNRIYIVPYAGTGTKLDPRRPAFLPAGREWSSVDMDTFAIVTVEDIGLAEHLALVAKPGVQGFREALDAGDRGTLRAALDAKYSGREIEIGSYRL